MKRLSIVENGRILLGCVLVLALLSGCGASLDVVGDYAAKAKLRDFLSQDQLDNLSELDEENGMGFLADVEMTVDLTLREDRSYTMAIDEEAFNEAVEGAFLEVADELVVRMLESGGLSEEEFDAFAKERGYSDYEELKRDAIDLLHENIEYAQEAWGAMLQGAVSEGTYVVKGRSVVFDQADANGSEVTATYTDQGRLDFSFVYSDEITLDLEFERVVEQ